MCIRSFLLIVVAVACFSLAISAQESLQPTDISVLEGAEWVGTLTYRDYKSSKPVSIKSNVLLTKSKGRSWNVEYRYPDEPNANSKGVIALSEDGKMFNDQVIVDFRRTPDGSLRLVTIKDGTDNNKKALFRYTYSISPKHFWLKKEVRLDGSAEFFERNTYSWTR